jgi:serine O-acetyltransferase
MGVVIGETSEIGSNVTLFHGVTLGGVSSHKGKRHPTIEDGVVIGAGAKVLGAITIGSCSRIGANAVVVKDVPEDSVVVGVPGHVTEKQKPNHLKPDLNHDKLPDSLEQEIQDLFRRVKKLEQHKIVTEEEDIAQSLQFQI